MGTRTTGTVFCVLAALLLAACGGGSKTSGSSGHVTLYGDHSKDKLSATNICTALDGTHVAGGTLLSTLEANDSKAVQSGSGSPYAGSGSGSGSGTAQPGKKHPLQLQRGSYMSIDGEPVQAVTGPGQSPVTIGAVDCSYRTTDRTQARVVLTVGKYSVVNGVGVKNSSTQTPGVVRGGNDLAMKMTGAPSQRPAALDKALRSVLSDMSYVPAQPQPLPPGVVVKITAQGTSQVSVDFVDNQGSSLGGAVPVTPALPEDASNGGMTPPWTTTLSGPAVQLSVKVTPEDMATGQPPSATCEIDVPGYPPATKTAVSANQTATCSVARSSYRTDHASITESSTASSGNSGSS